MKVIYIGGQGKQIEKEYKTAVFSTEYVCLDGKDFVEIESLLCITD